MQKVNIILNNDKDDSLNNLMEYKSAYINLRHNHTIDRYIYIKALNLKKTHLLSNINNYFQFKILIKKEILNINKAISYYI